MRAGVIVARWGERALSTEKERTEGEEPTRDRELAERCRGGEESALAEIVRTHRGSLYGAVYPIVLDPGSAEEVVQDAFVRFWRSVDRFEVGRPLYPWLRRIAVNVALSRVVRRRHPVISIEQTPEPARGGAPEEGLIEAEEVTRIEGALATLDPAKRAILELRAVEGLSYAEIAEALGCAVGTVMSRLCRARIELRERLGLEANQVRAAR